MFSRNTVIIVVIIDIIVYNIMITTKYEKVIEQPVQIFPFVKNTFHFLKPDFNLIKLNPMILKALNFQTR